MRLFLLATMTMTAFAANSVFNRLALAEGVIGPGSFAALRLLSGAVALAALIWWQRGGQLALGGRGRLVQTLALALYMLGFSHAYVTLDAGVGALILFGGVQVTMFAGAVLAREAQGPRRVIGAMLAFGGLAVLLWPVGPVRPLPLLGTLLMLVAALGWGVYSLGGRRAADPLASTAANFVLATPLALLLLLLLPDAAPVTASGTGLAVLSGVVTSGLGYALWYTVLPRLSASGAGVAQLSVPLIAAAGGFVLLAEVPDLRFWMSAVLVLGGVVLALWNPRRRAG